MRFFLFVLLLSCAAIAQPEWAASLSKDQIGQLNVPPCVLDFELGWNNTIKAGTARVTVQEAGPRYWRASAQAASTGFARTLWSYDCTMSSIISRETLHPVFMQHSETDRSETCRYRVAFQPRRVITESTVLPHKGTASTATHVCGFSPIEDLLSINEVNFKVYSAEDILGKAAELRQLADRLQTQPDAWRDDAMLNRMVELVRLTGDIRQNTLVPDQLVFRHDAFWANHFGGVYVFRDVAHAAAITVGPKEELGKLPIEYVFDLTDRNQIAKFLEINDLAEPIVRARGADAAAILRQKMDFILVDAADRLGIEVGDAR